MNKILCLLLITLSAQFVNAQEIEYYNNTLMQKVLDLPELQEYFELYKDNKHFLTLLDNGAADTERPLIKYGKPVEFMTRQQMFSSKVYHQLEINTIDINASTATIICLFPIEKLQINVYFKKEDQDNWIITDSRIYKL